MNQAAVRNEEFPHPIESGFFCDLCRRVHYDESEYILLPKPNRAPSRLMICSIQLKFILQWSPLRELYAATHIFPQLNGIQDSELKVFSTLEDLMSGISNGSARKLKQRIPEVQHITIVRKRKHRKHRKTRTSNHS